LKNSNFSEKERLRAKILEAIRFSKKFWITYRENTFGIASIVNLIYKKSFFEVLFFTNKDVLEKGVPLLKIYTPIEDEVDFNEIIFEPDFDEDGLISPIKIISRMRKLIRREFRKHLEILSKEVNLIDQKYENWAINNVPFHRKIRINFPILSISLDINFEKYPLLPKILFSKDLTRILSMNEFYEQEIIQGWNDADPLHIYEIVDNICNIIIKRLKIDPLADNSQHLVVKNLSIQEQIKNISFSIHRGKSLGIIFDEEILRNVDHRIELLDLFEAIKGNYKDFSGTIQVFGRFVQLLPIKEKRVIFILPEAYNSKIMSMNLKKAIQYDINIDAILKQKNKEIDETLKNAGISPRFDEIMGDIITGVPKRINKKREYIRHTLEVTGLLNKKKKNFSELTPLEFLLFSIGRALLQAPSIIMFSVPFGILGRLDFEKFNNYMDNIKRDFHLVLIFHAPEGVVSNCDQILTISKKESNIGTYDDLIKKLPYSGEIIYLELNNPQEDIIRKMYTLKEVDLIIEERKMEKFKIFVKENPNNLIVRLTELFGQSLFSFKKTKASLSEYIEFVDKKKIEDHS
jgi:ABC-type multidrug transport system ATPase subunit